MPRLFTPGADRTDDTSRRIVDDVRVIEWRAAAAAREAYRRTVLAGVMIAAAAAIIIWVRAR